MPVPEAKSSDEQLKKSSRILKSQNLIRCSGQEFRALHGKNKVDIAFVGSGLASTSVFLELLQLLETSTSPHLYKTYVFFDPDGDFGQGVTGNKSGKQSLLITPQKNFYQNPCFPFILWISTNFDELLNYQKRNLVDLQENGLLKTLKS